MTAIKIKIGNVELEIPDKFPYLLLACGIFLIVLGFYNFNSEKVLETGIHIFIILIGLAFSILSIALTIIREKNKK